MCIPICTFTKKICMVELCLNNLCQAFTSLTFSGNTHLADPAEIEHENPAEPSFRFESFKVCHEPVHELIRSFSSLYLEAEKEADEDFWPPPLPSEEERVP